MKTALHLVHSNYFYRKMILNFTYHPIEGAQRQKNKNWWIRHEHVGSKISAEIEIYTLTRSEFLCPFCYEIPCNLVLITLLQQRDNAQLHYVRFDHSKSHSTPRTLHFTQFTYNQGQKIYNVAFYFTKTFQHQIIYRILLFFRT